MRKPYPTDLTDAQWARIAPAFQQVRGRPRRVPARELLNAIFYFLRVCRSKDGWIANRAWSCWAILTSVRSSRRWCWPRKGRCTAPLNLWRL